MKCWLKIGIYWKSHEQKQQINSKTGTINCTKREGLECNEKLP